MPSFSTNPRRQPKKPSQRRTRTRRTPFQQSSMRTRKLPTSKTPRRLCRASMTGKVNRPEESATVQFSVLFWFLFVFVLLLLIAVSDFLFPGEELELEYEDKGRGTWLCRIKYVKITSFFLRLFLLRWLQTKSRSWLTWMIFQAACG